MNEKIKRNIKQHSQKNRGIFQGFKFLTRGGKMKKQKNAIIFLILLILNIIIDVSFYAIMEGQTYSIYIANQFLPIVITYFLLRIVDE